MFKTIPLIAIDVIHSRLAHKSVRITVKVFVFGHYYEYE